MAIRVQCVNYDAIDPAAQARFWADVLGWRITYEIEPISDGACSLTLTHAFEGGQATVAQLVSGQMQDRGDGGGGGHAWVLSDLKSLLETGSTLAG